MTPQEFIAKWGPGGPAYELNERQGAQPRFMDLCALLQVPTPGSLAGNPEKGSDYLVEQNTLVLGEARGYADVFYRGRSSWTRQGAASNRDVRQLAVQIATAVHRLNDLREAWLNPPEWTRKVPEVVPLGLAASPYPDRIEPRPGLPEVDMKALQQRTLTRLYNQRPAWLHAAHETLDAAVAAAYGWADYTSAMADDEILQRLLALNLERVG